MPKARMDVTAFVGKLLEEDDADLLREGVRLPEVVTSSEQRASELVFLLHQLPEKQRAAIVLHYYADRPVKDVAAALRVTPATARVHLHRGRRRLMALMEDQSE